MLALSYSKRLWLAPRRIFRWISSALWHGLPKGLYGRALIIIIAPIVLLEAVVAFVFMERHWQSVTRRLAEATAGDIGALIDAYHSYDSLDDYRGLSEMATRRFGLSVQILPGGELPPVRPKPFFDLLDRTLATQISKQVSQPFWIDTVGRSRHVEIRIKLDNAVMRVLAVRSQTYASNSHIFLIWMVGSSLVLLTVSIVLLRNQIRPIVRLAEAADAFGRGRPVPEDFKPRGAREVRQAAQSFLDMRDRIERHMEQRTSMLAGVSHDLRTILTRFKLQLAMFPDSPESEALRGDVNEMQLMLEDYMAFAKAGSGEEPTPTDVREMLEDIVSDVSHHGRSIVLHYKRRRKVPVLLRRQAFKRAIGNLVSNAVRYGERIVITTTQDRNWLVIEVEDDGPGIPPEKREDVFRPFFRLDQSRNVDQNNSGLGLAIARDIVRLHGGDVHLEESHMHGLKAVVRVPV